MVSNPGWLQKKIFGAFKKSFVPGCDSNSRTSELKSPSMTQYLVSYSPLVKGYPGPRGFLLFFIGKFCDANRFLNFFLLARSAEGRENKASFCGSDIGSMSAKRFWRTNDKISSKILFVNVASPRNIHITRKYPLEPWVAKLTTSLNCTLILQRKP